MSSVNSRRYTHLVKSQGLFLYGKLMPLKYATIYCDLHKCYLSSMQLKSKNCRFKKCSYLREIDKHKEVY